jgi:large subunit ribosomal protein L22
MAQRAEVVTARATARYVRMSPYKVRAVTELIRGKHIDEARRILAFTPREAARAVAKVLESAVANAEHNFQIPQEELRVTYAGADEGPIIYRGRPRAQGRYYRIRKRTCHIEVHLQRIEGAVEAPSGSAGGGRAGSGDEEGERKPRRRTRRPSGKASDEKKESEG